jgi:hypothetical protein
LGEQYVSGDKTPYWPMEAQMFTRFMSAWRQAVRFYEAQRQMRHRAEHLIWCGSAMLAFHHTKDTFGSWL